MGDAPIATFKRSHPKIVTAPPPVIPLILLTSHSHAPPLSPSPRLKYDLRSTPNPPKAIRDAHTGISKRLREHMLNHDAFMELLDKAERDIKNKVPIAERDFEEGKVGFTPLSPVASRKMWEEESEDEEEAEDEDTEREDEDGEGEGVDQEGDRPVVRVGAFCERGQHRSVAFIEELACRDWPKGWEVKIVHRDLGKRRGSMNKQKMRKPPVRSASIVLEED